MNPFELLAKSNNKLLQTEAEDMQKWSKLKHNKTDLGLLLRYNIVELEYLSNNDSTYHTIFCTSNVFLVKILAMTKEQVKKTNYKFNFNGYQVQKDNSVMTYDIVEKHPKTIPLRSWQINKLISITPENVLLLHEILNEI